MRIYDGIVSQWIEIHDLSDGKMKRLYSSFRDNDGDDKSNSEMYEKMDPATMPTIKYLEDIEEYLEFVR